MNRKFKTIVSIILTLCMLMSFVSTASAAQSNEYVDPAEVWLSSNSRTNELDINSTTTYETLYCTVCEKNTTALVYRVPEYTRSGETALNRDVLYSDGTKIDGRSKGNLDEGTPGIDAYYTGYHWTKSVCQTCGTINSSEGYAIYDFNNNVFSLNPCDNNFYLQFDNTTYEPHNEDYHLTTLKRGEYCKFCKGTYARATKGLEEHIFTKQVDGQIGNNRFYIAEKCDDCGFETSEYITAKTVVASYYGVEDGEAHTLTVSDLSESGVKTSVRYGTSADSCTRTSAPNYTQAGYYTVYYEIDYTYAGEIMTENGVSYVHIVTDDENNGTIVVLPQTHEHKFGYIETVKPSCEELGYERFQCDGCGTLEKRNYTPALGHNYDDIVIREATCKQGGLVLTICADCGDFYQTTTATGAHKYKAINHNPTCKNIGYTEYTCEVCGDNYINNIKPLISHSYERVTKVPTCLDKGYTTSTCTMCGYNFVDDYKNALGHDWDEGHTVTISTCDAEGVLEYHCLNECGEKMILATDATGHIPGSEANCTEPQICITCETILELPLGHSHTEEVIEPTCTTMGYTIFTCECGDSYITDYTDKIDHDYDEKVTEPTCTEHGYTTYTCDDCGDSYVSNYVDAIPHNYKGVVTEPTCTSMGFTTYTCEDCDDSYIGDYVDMTEHNYNKETVEPTCTEHGYAVYTCPDCGKSYIGDYKESIKHTYTETVIEATCTSMGYTIFRCNECEDEYKGNYIDKLPHDFEKLVTIPTCTEFGYSHYFCENCAENFVADYTDKLPHNYKAEVTDATCVTMGYTTYTCECGESYKADYKEPLGHTPSEWIVDVPATIENSGSKHIECSVCKETLVSVALPQLIDKDNSDEDGKAQIGDYSIILTDENGKPIFNSELAIDVNDNVTIKLTNGRLLDFEKPTTITAVYTETKKPKENLKIFIEDEKGNKAIGYTNKDGQLVVPNNKTNTNDDNGTIGKEDGETKETFVITVTDKTNVVIPGCDIYIGESNNVVVDLPEGIKPTREKPVIVTITDHNGKAQTSVTVIALGDADFIEKGTTDIYGKVTLPSSADGYTDSEGRVNINELNVLVNDEYGAIEKAYVKYNKDGTITVTLPEGKSISYENRVTVTVTESIGVPVQDISITVKELTDKSYTAVTDVKGKVVVPPLNEDITDNEGNSGIEEDKPGENEIIKTQYKVIVNNTLGVISDALVKIEDGKVYITLPETHTLTTDNQTTVTVKNENDEGIKGVSVIIYDKETSKEGVTDANGKVTLPIKTTSTGSSTRPSSGGGGGGGSYVTTSVKIVDKDGKTVSATRSVTSTKATLTLPTGKDLLKDDNYYTITVTSNSKAKADYPVVLKDKKGNEVKGVTDEEGVIVLPGKEHKAYIVGYSGGAFKPDNDMTRDEAAAIFARLIAEEKGETITGNASFKDVNTKHWASKYIGYLEKYGIIKGYKDDTFRPDDAVTRAEFVTMAVRYYALFNDVKKSDYTVNYTDLTKSYWAYSDIAYAKHIGWLNGYADGTFKGDNNITRAEVVTVTNHATERTPDAEFINKNVANLNKFTDLKNNSHWAYYEIMEAANTHLGIANKDNENWVK